MRKLRDLFCRHGYRLSQTTIINNKTRYFYTCAHCGKIKVSKKLKV